LRRGRELGWWIARIAAVEMLLDRLIDLGNCERVHVQQLLEEVVDRLLSPLVAVEDGLGAPARLRGADARPRARRALWTWHDPRD
jgi:hypothetical protein